MMQFIYCAVAPGSELSDEAGLQHTLRAYRTELFKIDSTDSWALHLRHRIIDTIQAFPNMLERIAGPVCYALLIRISFQKTW